VSSRTVVAARPNWSLRVGAALAGVAGGIVLAASPAHAEPGQVSLRVSGDLATDNVPREAVLQVTRTDRNCVRVKTLMTVQMSGLQRDEIEIAVNENGTWVPLNTVQLTDDAVSSAPVVPANAQLCQEQRIQVRYRVTFTGDAPDGRVDFIGEAFNSTNADRLDRTVETRQVLQGTGNSRANDDEDEPARNNPGTVDEDDTVGSEADPDDEETPEAGAAAEDDTDAPAAEQGNQAAGVDLTTAAGQTTFFNGLGPLIIVVGVGMTGIGGALLVTVMRRTRADPDAVDEDEDGFTPRTRGRGRRGPLLASTVRR
jgi:hypothetical protein